MSDSSFPPTLGQHLLSKAGMAGYPLHLHSALRSSESLSLAEIHPPFFLPI